MALRKRPLRVFGGLPARDFFGDFLIEYHAISLIAPAAWPRLVMFPRLAALAIFFASNFTFALALITDVPLQLHTLKLHYFAAVSFFAAACFAISTSNN